MINLRPTFEKLFPEGVKGGQCAAFAEKLTEFGPVDTLDPHSGLNSKTEYVKRYGIPVYLINESYRPGDVIVTSESLTDGHVTTINARIGRKLQLTESNYKGDKRVHHTRLIDINDPKIVGIIRGPAKYPLPQTTYPIQIRVKILMNNQPMWNSLLGQMAKLQNWFWEKSANRIELIVDYKDTSLSGWPTVITGSGIGTLSEIIDEKWYDVNILPLSEGAIVTSFVMKKSDFAGIVNTPGQKEVGYCYAPHYPIKTFLVFDEGDDYPPTYTGLSGLSELLAHEISHGLFGLALSSKWPNGADFTHQFFYGSNGNQPYPEGIFSYLDFDLLNRQVSG